MNNKNRVTFTPRSTSRNSFPVPFTMDNSIVTTTTTTQSSTWKIPVNLAWRRAIVSTPNRPPIVIQPTIMASSMTDNSLKQKDPKNKFQSDDNANDDDFDAFILDNFVRFTGNQNAVLWFDQTEQKFDELRIGRRLRFKAIPLLIGGAAKSTYLTHQKQIRSLDNFYEFLRSEFGKSSIETNQYNCNHGTDNNQPPNLPTPFKPQSADNSTLGDVHLSDSTKLIRQTSVLCSTALFDTGATSILGETSATASANATDNLSLSTVDQTLNDLRRAVIVNLIKYPKTFKGAIDEIKHLLDVAHVPDSTRLDLISYSLHGGAFERFKAMDQAHSSFLTDQAREMFPSISYNRYKKLGYEASACSTL